MRYLPFAVVAIAMIYTLVDCVRSEPTAVRSMPRFAWFFVILLLPVVGIVLWFLFGRPQAVGQPATPAPRTVAPDDDPRFLHDLDERRWRERAAERRAQQSPTQRPADRPADSAETPRAENVRGDETRTGDSDTSRDSRSGRTPRDPAQDQAGPDEATGA